MWEDSIGEQHRAKASVKYDSDVENVVDLGHEVSPGAAQLIVGGVVGLDLEDAPATIERNSKLQEASSQYHVASRVCMPSSK